MKKRALGFTLIELILVASIIGLLAAIAIPKFANMIVKAKESAVRGSLGAIRGALVIYYADNEGFYPYPTGMGNVGDIFTAGGKYMEKIPYAEVPTNPSHLKSNTIKPVGIGVWHWIYMIEPVGWTYAVSNQTWQVYVNCTESDSSGRGWSTW